MKTINKRYFLASLIATGLATCMSAHAQDGESDSCGCNAVLIPTEVKMESNEVLRYADLSIIDQSNFEEIKQKRGGSITIPIEGVPVKASGDYEDFTKKRAKYFSESRISFSRELAHSLLVKELAVGQVDAWSKCKSDCLKGRGGFDCWVEKYDDQAVTVRFLWSPPELVPTGWVQSSQLFGADSVAGAAKGEVFPPGPRFDKGKDGDIVIFTRHANETFRMSIKVSNRPKYLEVPWGTPSPPKSDIIGTWSGSVEYQAPNEDLKFTRTLFIANGPNGKDEVFIDHIQSDPKTGKSTSGTGDLYLYKGSSLLRFEGASVEELKVSGNTMTGEHIERIPGQPPRVHVKFNLTRQP